MVRRTADSEALSVNHHGEQLEQHMLKHQSVFRRLKSRVMNLRDYRYESIPPTYRILPEAAGIAVLVACCYMVNMHDFSLVSSVKSIVQPSFPPRENGVLG